MTLPLPFPVDIQDPSRGRALMNGLNDPRFLARSLTVPLTDDYPDGRSTFGIIATDSLGALAPEYIANCRNCTATGTTAVAINTLRAVPFIHSNGFRLQTLAFAVTTGGGAGSVARCGIYDSTDDLYGSCYPYRLIRDCGEVITTVAGGTGSKATTLNIDLEEGRMYWAVYVCGTAAPTIATLAVGGVDHLMAASAGAASTLTTHLSVAFTYAALPVIFPTGATAQTSAPPALFLLFTSTCATKRTRTIPLWSARSGGYSILSARLSRGSSLGVSGPNRPFNVITLQTRTSDGARALGTFDSRTSRIVAGRPFDLIGGDTDIALAANEEVVVKCEQYGWPKVTLRDTAVTLDYIYTGGV